MGTPRIFSWDLEGWKDISAALGVSVTTAKRWHRERGMPVDRLSGLVRAESRRLRAWATSSGLVVLAA